MSNSSAQQVLTRKTQAHRTSVSDSFPPEKALSVAVLRACDKGLDMHAVAGAIKGSVLSLTELLESLPDKGLLATLDGPQGALGLVTLDSSALAALVEQMTVGTVLNSAPDDRRATRTDAALLADWVNTVLTGMVAELFEAAEEPALAIKATVAFDGYSFGRLITDPRPLALMLEDVNYRVLDVVTAFGDVGREGRILVALVDRPPMPEPIDDELRAAQWRSDMSKVLCEAPAELDAVLHRMELPIARLRTLEPGDLISIPATTVGEVRLEASDGTCVGIARLGQSLGQRAVRLIAPPSSVDEAAEGFEGPQEVPDMAPQVPEIELGPGVESGLVEGIPVTEAPDLPNLPGLETGGDDLPDLDGLPEIDLDGDFPDLGGDADLPDLDSLPDLGGADDGLPDLSDLGGGDGDLPSLDDLPSMDDLPDLGDLGGDSDFPSLDDLPKIE